MVMVTPPAVDQGSIGAPRLVFSDGIETHLHVGDIAFKLIEAAEQRGSVRERAEPRRPRACRGLVDKGAMIERHPERDQEAAALINGTIPRA
jgi:hypothetical protein